GIHVSGHGAQEDQKLMLALTKPKFFVPVHGEHRMLVKHSQMAQQMGIPQENTVIINNGDIIELTEQSIGIVGQVSNGIELVDRAGIVHDSVMKERQQLAEDGVITIAAAVNSEGKLIATPEIHWRGVVTSVERSLVQQLIIRAIENTLNERWSEFERNSGNEVEIDWTGLRIDLESTLQRTIKRELQSLPLVVFLLQTSEAESSPTSTSRKRRRSTATLAS
ncbi:MAG: MBL fold metallo-hydrolase RNA specificity domain-containing protein, partial [Xenococcaceae cyanobacterium]